MLQLPLLFRALRWRSAMNQEHRGAKRLYLAASRTALGLRIVRVIAHPPPGCIKIMFIKGLSIQASSEPILSILERSAWGGIRGHVLK